MAGSMFTAQETSFLGSASAPGRVHSNSGRTPYRAVPQLVVRVFAKTIAACPPSTWLVIDVMLLVMSFQTAFTVYNPASPLETPHIALWQAMTIFSFTTIIASLVFGLYERETLMSRSRILTRMMLMVSLSAVLAYALIYVVMYATVSRRVAGMALGLYFTSASTLRLCAWCAIHRLQRGLLVVGPASLFRSFRGAQDEGFLHEYQLVGYVGSKIEALTAATVESDETSSINDPHFLGDIEQQLHNLHRLQVTDIVVDGAAGNGPAAMSWIVPSLQAGCRVTNEATFYEKATGQILVDGLSPNWFLFADLKLHCDEHATLKRVVDLFVAIIGLCASAPIWALIALLIKVCDSGPVFYWQDRIGQHGRVFRLYKFRTMRCDAENGKSVWCAPNDPRVTRVGRILRRSRLDELPQLFNVLMGQMSIVGPRPERPDIVAELEKCIPYYSERHLVKPGITGWAQISFRYGSSIEDAKRKLRFDLYYLKHMSLELDLIILFRTAGTFLRGGC